MSNKTKQKICMAIMILLVMLVINPYIIDFTAGMLFQNGQWQFRLNLIKVYQDIFADRNYITFLGCLAALEIYAIMSIGSNENPYKSELMTITPDIRTPVPVGQNQCGSAKWLDKKRYDDVIASFILDKSGSVRGELNQGGLVIGKKDIKNGEQIYYLPEDNHGLIIGATRSGKGRCLVLQSIGCLGLAGESLVVNDPKGELSDYTEPFLTDKDYRSYVLDFDTPERSIHWNFLQMIIDELDAGNTPGAIDATWDLVSQLVGESKGERIWTDGEASTIAGCILSVVYDNRAPENHKYRNLTNVYYFLTEMCTAVSGILPINIYKNNLPDNHPAKGLFAVGDIAPSRTRGSFYTSAVMTLKMFTNPMIAAMTADSEINLQDLGREKSVVYIISPEDRDTYDSLVTLFFVQIYQQLSKESKEEGGYLKNRVNFIWDEFGNSVEIPIFRKMLTVGGGKALRFYLFLQGFSQLEELYDKAGAATIMGNCDNWIYLRSNDVDTREMISKQLGEYTISSYSKNTSTSSKNDSTGASMNLTGRRLLTPEEVKNIRRPYSLYISENDPAIMYAPDLSKWQFNRFYHMGSKAHNQKLRRERLAERPKRPVKEVELWGIWKVYQDAIKETSKKAAAKKAAGKED